MKPSENQEPGTFTILSFNADVSYYVWVIYNYIVESSNQDLLLKFLFGGGLPSSKLPSCSIMIF